MTILINILIFLFILVLLLAFSLPALLKKLGFHPDYEKNTYMLQGKKALLIATNQSTLGESGKATGAYGSELTIAYYEFLDAGMNVDIASIKGGEIPFEPQSLKYPLATHADKRYLADNEAKAKTKNSIKIDDVDVLNYDIIYMAGGWGASYDLGQSDVLGEQLTKAHANNILLGSVCHGALGFIKAKEIDGKPLLEGKNITAVTDKQIKELGITQTPLHPETEIRKLGAHFKSNTKKKDFLASLVIVDKNIVTGQNQNSSGETAQELLKLLDNKQ